MGTDKKTRTEILLCLRCFSARNELNGILLGWKKFCHRNVWIYKKYFWASTKRCLKSGQQKWLHNLPHENFEFLPFIIWNLTPDSFQPECHNIIPSLLKIQPQQTHHMMIHTQLRRLSWLLQLTALANSDDNIQCSSQRVYINNIQQYITTTNSLQFVTVIYSVSHKKEPTYFCL